MAKLVACFGSCVCIITTILIAFDLLMTASDTQSNYEHDIRIVPYYGIVVGRGTVVYSCTDIVISIVVLVLGICFLIDSLASVYFKAIVNIIFMISIATSFNLPWFIVIAVLFFTLPLWWCRLMRYDFGLCLFIINAIILGCSLLAAKNKKDS